MGSARAGRYRLVWLVKDVAMAEQKLNADFPDRDRERVKIVAKNTLRGMYWFLRSRYVFFSHVTYWFVRSSYHQVMINLWHGMPIKRIGAQFEGRSLLEIPCADYSVATSELFGDVISEALLVPRPRVLITGLPRNAWLLQKDVAHEAVKEGRTRLAVWLPTFRQLSLDGFMLSDSENANDPINSESLAQLDAKLDGADLLLLLKFHPGDVKNHAPWPEYRNIRVLPDLEMRRRGLNVYKLLACSDAMISDFSSIAIDYLFLRRPLGIFVPDKDSYVRGFIPGIFEKLAALCPRLDSLDAIAEFLRDPRLIQWDPEILNDLHRPDLDEPSRSVLKAAGLGDLLSSS